MKKEILYLMVDIETYGTNPYAVVRQIACVPFTIGEAINIRSDLYFNEYADTSSQRDRTTDAATIRWWQSEDNREVNLHLLEKEKEVGRTPVDLAVVWVKYIEKLKKTYSLRYIGRGATTFDIPIISNFCRMYGKEFSPAYYTIYDMRSFVSICSAFAGRDLNGSDDKGAHEALYDCTKQIAQLIKCVNAICDEAKYDYLEVNSLFNQLINMK